MMKLYYIFSPAYRGISPEVCLPASLGCGFNLCIFEVYFKICYLSDTFDFIPSNFDKDTSELVFFCEDFMTIATKSQTHTPPPPPIVPPPSLSVVINGSILLSILLSTNIGRGRGGDSFNLDVTRVSW